MEWLKKSAKTPQGEEWFDWKFILGTLYIAKETADWKLCHCQEWSHPEIYFLVYPRKDNNIPVFYTGR